MPYTHATDTVTPAASGLHRIAQRVIGVSIVAALAVMVGCAASPNGDAAEGQGETGDVLGLIQPGEQDASILRLTNTENGLEVRNWTTRTSGDAIRQVLLSHGAVSASDAETEALLRRNGLTFLSVDATELEPILRDLGSANLGATSWYGQVFDWRALVERRIQAAQTPMAINGRIRRLPAGELDLMIRSWVMPMEDGPHLHFEMAPQFTRPTNADLRRLMSNESNIASFEGLVMTAQLDPNSIYILTLTQPDEDWSADALANQPPPTPPAADPGIGGAGGDGGSGGDSRQDGESGSDAADPPPVFGGSPRLQIGPADDVLVPPTLGELFLTDRRVEDQRTVFFLVPRIRADLYPDGSKPAASQADPIGRPEPRP